jgi:hypothetical protein
MAEFGRIMIISGIVIALCGVVLLYAAGQFEWLNRLPGNFVIERENARIFFPLTTMILVSVIGTLILNLVLRFFRR